MTDEIKTLADGLPEQQARVRDLITMYRSIGPAGVPASMLMERSLKYADIAASSGDVVEMLRAYNDLKGYTS